MYGDLRESNEEYILPLSINTKGLIYAGYGLSIIFVFLCILSLITSYYIQVKIDDCNETIVSIDDKIDELEGAISDKCNERLKTEKIMDWTLSSLPMQSLIVEMLDALPVELKIKNISATIIEDQYKFELIIDIIGKKHESLQFAKKTEKILNSYGYKSASNSNIELVYGNRIIITAYIS